MTNTIVNIYNMNGNIFKEIEYTTINELNKKLTNLVLLYDAGIHIQLLINENNLNNFNIIDTNILSTILEYGFINVIFIEKKEFYCLRNDYGTYILKNNNDNYSELLKLIIFFYKNESYNLITTYSYKYIVSIIVTLDGCSLEYISKDLQNNKEIVLKAVKRYGLALEFASIDLKNDKDIVLKAVKHDGRSFEFASINLKNDKEFILECIKKNSNSLQYVSIDLKNDKEFILECINHLQIPYWHVSTFLYRCNIIISDVNYFYLNFNYSIL